MNIQLLFSAALRVTPAVESLVEPIGTDLTLNCSSSEEGNFTWSVRLPDENFERSSTDTLRPLPPNFVAVDGPGFSQLHITVTQESNGSTFSCQRLLVNGSLQSSDPILAVFFGQLPQIVGCLPYCLCLDCACMCRTSQCPR
jgi:hypothetical protein